MEKEFDDRVALVTGGSRGIGRAIALQLARQGARVAVSYATRRDAAEEVVAQIARLGGQAIALPCDIARQEQVDELVGRTREQLGPIDLLAHCAAISNMATHDAMNFERWNETIDVNLHGTYRVVFAVKDEMIHRRFGRIVLLSSVAALRHRPNQFHYAAAKAGVIAFGGCCAAAFAPHNVRVNSIAPGVIDTEMAQVFRPEQLAEIVQATPLGRLGQAEEVAEVACFLLSERSSFMTGQTLVVSGGRVALP